jgi:hypothetical protein
LAYRDPEKKREWARANGRRLRQTVISHYGGKCDCCGESRIEFLAVDHINGGGNEHRRQVGNGHNMYAWIVRNSFPDMFRILCYNCNHSLGMYGRCPHEES